MAMMLCEGTTNYYVSMYCLVGQRRGMYASCRAERVAARATMVWWEGKESRKKEALGIHWGY